jgi:hypothetical protein
LAIVLGRAVVEAGLSVVLTSTKGRLPAVG